ncbi:hypothetical protein ACWC10_09390 [Streptomyces sp. NPDC001595]|uniref:hypothetical protein n=1 Tax=Streptomyces sp. NPDC001532 TaxID=3154520 RepID=UPI00332068AC
MTRRPHPAVPRAVLPAVLGVVLVALLGLGASACQSVAVGPVLSAAEYRERVAGTEAAGERALGDLEPVPVETGGGFLEEANGSCVDDFGFDETGVTRDEPTYEWALEFADRDAYLAAVENLHRLWSERGYDVERVEPQPDVDLPGVTATDDDGVELTLAPDWYTGKPVLRADGGCVRHEYSFADEESSSAH